MVLVVATGTGRTYGRVFIGEIEFVIIATVIIPTRRIGHSTSQVHLFAMSDSTISQAR